MKRLKVGFPVKHVVFPVIQTCLETKKETKDKEKSRKIKARRQAAVHYRDDSKRVSHNLSQVSRSSESGLLMRSPINCFGIGDMYDM